MNPKPLMKCGHAANATNTLTGKPSCAICVGITANAEEIAETPDLSLRRARCNYFGKTNRNFKNESNYGCLGKAICDCEQPSSTDLPFFELRMMDDFDKFYCGCKSWN